MKENHNSTVLSKLVDNVIVRWDKDILGYRYLCSWNNTVSDLNDEKREGPFKSEVVLWNGSELFTIDLP